MLVIGLSVSLMIAAAMLGVGISSITEIPSTRPIKPGDVGAAVVVLWVMVIPVALAAASLGNVLAAWVAAGWLTAWALYLSARTIMKIGRTPQRVTKRAGVLHALINFSFLFVIVVTLGVVTT